MRRPSLISVVIPAFNAGSHLAQCLDSVCAQTRSDHICEIVVVDDGSTDSTPEVASRYGTRVTLLRQANSGDAAARNTGILAARGDLIAFLDSDDVWLPEYLGKQLDVYEASGGDCLVFCDVYAWDGVAQSSAVWNRGHRFDEDDPLRSIVAGYTILPSAAIVPRNALLGVGLFQNVPGKDRNLWRRLAQSGLRFRRNPSALVLYRVRSLSVSHGPGKGRKGAENLLPALQRIMGDEAYSAQIRQTAAERAAAIPRYLVWLSVQALLSGDVEEARACLGRAREMRRWNIPYALGTLLLTRVPRMTCQSAVTVHRLLMAARRLRFRRVLQ